VHWDDDDWSGGDRVSDQVRTLTKSGADFVRPESRALLRTGHRSRLGVSLSPGGRPWAYGATLCYTKAFWRRNPFPDTALGEDTRFVWSNCPSRLEALDDRRWFVATIHTANTSPKQVSDRRWRRCETADVRSMAGIGWEVYRHAIGGRA